MSQKYIPPRDSTSDKDTFMFKVKRALGATGKQGRQRPTPGEAFRGRAPREPHRKARMCSIVPLTTRVHQEAWLSGVLG